MTYLHSPERTAITLLQLAVTSFILAWGLLLPGTAGATGNLIQAKNFRADAQTAARLQVPIMVLFSSPNCPYCERVKREYLVPMHNDPAYRKRVIFREITVNSTTPLTAFGGARTTEGAFAAENKVFIVPTVMAFDPHGKPTGEAIVGLLIPDFYFGALETAIDEGLSKVRSK